VHRLRARLWHRQKVVIRLARKSGLGFNGPRFKAGASRRHFPGPRAGADPAGAFVTANSPRDSLQVLHCQT
jgi:hypothetical protein